MKRMLFVVVGLMLMCAAPAVAQKNKVKNKDKRFETVVKSSPAEYAGRYYAGTNASETEYYIEVKADAAGNLSITSFEGSRRAQLRDIRLEQGKLTATKVYEDGTTQEFAATFANRILKGVSLFGMVIEGPVNITPTVTVNRVFYRRE